MAAYLVSASVMPTKATRSTINRLEGFPSNEKSGVTEKDVMELDEKVKRELWRKIRLEKGL